MALQLQKILDNPEAQVFNNLANLVDLASTAATMYVVQPADPNSEVFLFDTRGEEEAKIESDITDNWIENNSAIQDHIGLKPLIITLRGYVGELTNKVDPDIQELLRKYENSSDKAPNLTVAPLNPFLPSLTTQAQYIVNRAEEVYGVYKKANKTVNRIDEKMAGIPTADLTRQQEVFNKLKLLWENRSLSYVYTPYGIFPNMAILTLNARQDEETKSISEFSVTFKQIRIADQVASYYDPEREKSAKAAMQLAKQQDKGIKKPVDKSLSAHMADEGILQGSKNYYNNLIGK